MKTNYQNSQEPNEQINSPSVILIRNSNSHIPIEHSSILHMIYRWFRFNAISNVEFFRSTTENHRNIQNLNKAADEDDDKEIGKQAKVEENASENEIK